MSWEFREEAQVLEALGRQFKFPSTYLVLDLETTGFSKAKDFIIDAGWAVVKDNQIVNHTSLLLNWSLVPNVDHGFIRSQLLRQADDYAKVNRPHYYPWERLCDEGLHPFEVIHAYTQLIYDHIMHGSSMIVGHGLWRFDREFINGHTQRFLQGYLLPWQLHSVLDTGLIEKAAQMGSPPWATETLDTWLQRISNAHSKVKWNLSGHCAGKYRLVERYAVDLRLAHTAGFDCLLTHFLLQTFKELIEILHGQRQEITGTQAVGRTG